MSPPQSPSRRAAECPLSLGGGVSHEGVRRVRPQNKHGTLDTVELLQLAFYLGYRFYSSTLQTKIPQLS